MSGVLITGATTPIGSALVRALLEDPEAGHVIAVGYESREALAVPHHPNLTYARIDLTRSRSLRELLFGVVRERAITSVIHAALHRSARDVGRRVHALNVDATRELLHLCERHPTIRRFVYRSVAEVYRVRAELPVLIDEGHPIDLSPQAPQWVRDRVEADLAVCTRMGISPLRIVVLRCAECLAPGTGGQLYDYLRSRVCLLPLGFDPMVNVLSLDDAVSVLHLALKAPGDGIFNIPGRDTLPLSVAVARWGRLGLPVPEFALDPLYRARARVRGAGFRYDMNHWRFHFSAVLDGRRARDVLGFEPRRSVAWPVPAL